MDASKTDLLKKTPTDYNIHELIANRWSPRVFADTPITDTDLKFLFEAGRWAPSSYNTQPWRVVWGIKGSKTYDRIMKHLVEFNQGWAKNAHVLLLTFIKTHNDDGDELTHAEHDLGQFAALMSVQAQSMGIAAHQMSGLNADDAKKEFKFPEGYKAMTAIALGHYGGDIDELPSDQLKEQEKSGRQRNPQEEFTFAGDYVDRADISDDK